MHPHLSKTMAEVHQNDLLRAAREAGPSVERRPSRAALIGLLSNVPTPSLRMALKPLRLRVTDQI